MSRRFFQFFSLLVLLFAALVESQSSLADTPDTKHAAPTEQISNALIAEIFGDKNADTLVQRAPPLDEQDNLAREFYLLEQIWLAHAATQQPSKGCDLEGWHAKEPVEIEQAILGESHTVNTQSQSDDCA